MKNTLMLLLPATLIAFFSHAQNVSLVNSGEVLQRAAVLKDSGQYDLAIKELLVVPQRDTNYLRSQSELARLYLYNKQYDQALKTADWMLARKTEFRASMFEVKASTFEVQKNFDKALAILDPALKEFPFNLDLRYLLAKTYHNKKDFANAIKAYFSVLEIAPFSSNAHLNLGHISVWTGQKTHGVLSIAMYLSLIPTDNSKLQYLESVLKNEIDDEAGGNAKPTGNAFERLDQILKSKIALDKKFKATVPIDVAVVRQMEMLLQQLNTVSTSVDDPWVKFYLPIYTNIRDQKLMEPFIYHLVSSSDIESVAKWNEKNQDRREAFFNSINQLMVKKREMVSVPPSLGIGGAGNAEYFKDQNIYGVGQIKDGKKHGKWVYFFSGGRMSGEGAYAAGEKTGDWKYFAEDGSQTSLENSGSGDVTMFYPDGAKKVHYTMKDGGVNGDVTLYFPCGQPSENMTFKGGQRDGKGKLVYENGSAKIDYEYAAGQKINTWTEYYQNGKPKERKNFKANQLEGVHETFWADGKIKSRDTYVADKRQGASEAYHENGKLQTKGDFANDHPVGEWIHYNAKGDKLERRFYNSEGKIDGERIFYYQGKVWSNYTVKNDVISQITWYDASGKEFSKSGSPDGTFKAKHFYETGQLSSEGSYKNGKKDGKWTRYYIDGLVLETNNYVDGEMDGEQTEFYQNGKRKSITPFKKGVKDGYAQTFYVSGTIKSQGWNVNGKSEQQWLSYYPDGQLMTDQYFMNGTVRDTAYFLAPNGKPTIKMFYEDGRSTSEILIDPNRQLLLSNSTMNETRTYKYPNGTTQARYNIACGKADGILERFYSDGTVGARLGYSGDMLHGVYEEYDESGKVSVKARHENGQRQGLWNRIGELGKIEQSIPYINGSSDSVVTLYYKHGPVGQRHEYVGNQRNGVTSFYAPDGTVVIERLYIDGDIYSIRTREKNGQFGSWKPFSSNMKLVGYYPTGIKAHEEQYVAGTLSGPRRIYFPDGKLCKEYNLMDGEYEGAFTDYYPNGKVSVKGQYHADEYEGVVEVFDETGVKLRSTNYSFGKKHGPVVLYSKGVKSKEFEYYFGMLLK